MVKRQIKVLLVKDEEGYQAFAAELRGCQTCGDTAEEALANLRDVVESWFWTLDDDQVSAMDSVEIVSTSIEVSIGDRAP